MEDNSIQPIDIKDVSWDELQKGSDYKVGAVKYLIKLYLEDSKPNKETKKLLDKISEVLSK